MNDIEVSSIDLVEGGNVFKQGHYLTLGYIPRDEKGETVDLSGKKLNVSLWGRKGVVFEAAATYSGGVIRFTLDKMVPAGDYTVEFTVTSSTDAKYRKKFPTNQHSGRIAIKQSADDLGVVGIQVYTVAQLKAEQKALLDAAVSGFTVDSETKMARVSGSTTYTSLPARLEADKQATAAQLEEKTNKGDVAISDINKNKGLIDESYLSDTLKKQMAGTTPIGSTPPDDSITLKKTTFYKAGKNLFNKSTITSDKYLRGNTGAADVDNASYFTSDFIPVQPNTTYARSFVEVAYAYDSNKVFIPGSLASGTFTTPTNANFIRFSSPASQINLSQIELGTVATAYEAYYLTLDTAIVKEKSIEGTKLKDDSIEAVKLKKGAITPEKLSGYNPGKNLFNKEVVTIGRFINQNSGALSTNANYNASDWIEVLPNITYTLKNSQYTAFYTSNKTYISGFAEGQPATFTTPANAAFMRTSATMTQLDTQQVEIGSITTTYEPFGFRLNKLLPHNADVLAGSIKPLLEQDYVLTLNTFKGLNLCVYGDSITAPGIWAADVVNAFGFAKLYNRGWSDSGVTMENKTLYINSDGTYNSNPLNTSPQPADTTAVQSSFSHDDRIDYVPTDTDVVLIMGGTNDYLRHHPIGGISYPYDESTFIGALCLTHEKIQNKLPNALIVFMTPIIKPVAQGNPNPAVNYDGITVWEYVKAVREASDYLGVPLIDVHRNAGINLHNTVRTISPDGTHPNGTLGHKMISSAVIGGLKAITPVPM